MKKLQILLPAFFVTILADGLIGVALAAPVKQASCEEKYKAVAAVAGKMPYWEFDQSKSGWRKLESCPVEAAKLLGRYVKMQESDLRNVRWHMAQMLALAGNNLPAAEEATKSLNPDEAEQHPEFSWNAYVQATVHFLRNERAAFDVQSESLRLAAEKHPENKTNYLVLVGLAKCFGKPYQEAYINCRPAK